MDRPQVAEASLAQEPATTELTKRQILVPLAEAQGLGFFVLLPSLRESHQDKSMHLACRLKRPIVKTWLREIYSERTVSGVS
jgi:hypothetical protein